MNDATHFGAKRIDRLIEASSRGFDEHFAYGGAGYTHAVNTSEPHGSGAAGGLHVHIFGDDADGVGGGSAKKRGNGIETHVLRVEKKSFGKRAIGEKRIGGSGFGADVRPIGVEFIGSHLGE